MATLLCLSPQTKSIISSIIPAGQGPACLQKGGWEAQAVAPPPAARLCPAGTASSPGSPARPVSRRRGPTWLQHPCHQLPPASCSPHSFPLPPVPWDARHSDGTALGEQQGRVWVELGPLVACPHPKRLHIHGKAPCSTSTSSSGQAGRAGRPVSSPGGAEGAEAAIPSCPSGSQFPSPQREAGAEPRGNRPALQQIPPPAARRRGRPWPPTWHVPACP